MPHVGNCGFYTMGSGIYLDRETNLVDHYPRSPLQDVPLPFSVVEPLFLESLRVDRKDQWEKAVEELGGNSSLLWSLILTSADSLWTDRGWWALPLWIDLARSRTGMNFRFDIRLLEQKRSLQDVLRLQEASRSRLESQWKMIRKQQAQFYYVLRKKRPPLIGYHRRRWRGSGLINPRGKFTQEAIQHIARTECTER